MATILIIFNYKMRDDFNKYSYHETIDLDSTFVKIMSDL